MITPRITTAVLGAFDRLLADARRAAVLAVAGSEEERFFRAEAGAYFRAREMFEAGIVPEQQPGGDWRVASADGTQVYTVTRGGLCSCKAGQNGRHCKHCSLVAAYETGLDDLNTYDDYDIESDYADAAKLLFARIADARAHYLREVA